MKKKAIMMAMTAVLMTLLMGMTTFAATPACTGYVDANGDGVCDTCGNAVGQHNTANHGTNDTNHNGTCLASKTSGHHSSGSHNGGGHE